MNLRGVSALKELNNKDFRILVAIELGMRDAEFVDIDTIVHFTKYNKPLVERLLKKLHNFNLIHRWTGHFIGYELTIHGYDTLALNALYEKKIVMSIGREKGVGKESRVYYALDYSNNEVVIKLHRVGYTSFQHVKKKRSYTKNKYHISELYASRLSAEAESKWLTLSNKLNLPVPKIFGINRHIIVEELIYGEELSKIRFLEDPIEVFETLLDFIRIAWVKGNFVHGDLSEHNVIINETEQPIIIDFPQAVSINHSNAIDMLKRDIHNICTFFNRKYKIIVNEKDIINEIL